jgi:hypothetical protein
LGVRLMVSAIAGRSHAAFTINTTPNQDPF